MDDRMKVEVIQKMLNPTKFKMYFAKKINERLGGLGLSEGQVFFLIALDRKTGMSLKELTEEVGVHKSLTTRMVKYLIENGFVEDLTESGKEYSAVLTAKGKKAKDDTIEALEAVMSDIFQDLTDEDMDSLMSISEKIMKRMEMDGDCKGCCERDCRGPLS